MFAVLDLGLGESGLIVDAPINRPEAFIDVTSLKKFSEKARGRGLVFMRHRQIRIRPLTQDAKPRKIARLTVHRMFRVFAAETAKRCDGQIIFILTFSGKLFLDIRLDRQAVAVISGHIRRVKTHHRPRFDDKILKNFVQGRADMNVRVRIRGTIMKNEFVTPFPCVDHLFIKPHLGPFLQPCRLALAKIRLLGKIRFGKVNCLFKI